MLNTETFSSTVKYTDEKILVIKCLLLCILFGVLQARAQDPGSVDAYGGSPPIVRVDAGVTPISPEESFYIGPRHLRN